MGVKKATKRERLRKLHEEQAEILKQAMLDAGVPMPGAEPDEELTEDEQELRKLGFVNSAQMRYNFRA
jgi:hypothetical protein